MRVADLPIVLWMWGWQNGWMVRSGWRWRWWTGRGGVGCGPVGGSGLGWLHLGWGPHIRRPPADRRQQTPDKKRNFIWNIVTGSQSSVWLMHHQKWEWTLTNANLSLQPAQCWRDCSHDALLGKTRTDWRKHRNPPFLSEDGHVFTSSPGRVQQKFTAHTIPQQYWSPTLQTLI